MAATTVRDLIELALKRARVLGKGDILDDEDAQEALDAVNLMLDSWSLDRLFVYVEELQSFDIMGAQSYTIGIGGDFNVQRPNKIVSAYAQVNSISYPMEILENGQQYDRIALKSLGGVWPSYVWYEKTYPLGTLHFWPTGASTVKLRFTKQLQQFSSLTDQVVLPPGYKEAIVAASAVKLAESFNTELAPTAIQTAANAIARLKRANSQPATRPCEVALISGRYGFGGAGIEGTGNEFSGGNPILDQGDDFILAQE